ncbi:MULTISPECIES: antitoxin [Rhodococcus]|uniref:antitoxin n=1 Tax=Rhodococcus TaxID=1827 RepID=UPI0002DB5E34|nr:MULTISPECIES: antitoxin [Rhodococcus]MCQ4150458.1 antitoxin [Rhodococcus qingshengii]MDV8015102.1 antitoxin [Rhodococcus sp. IEGM 1241]
MKLTGAAKALVDKGMEAASKNADKIENAIDKTAAAAETKTGGKLTSQIQRASFAAKRAIPPKK